VGSGARREARRNARALSGAIPDQTQQIELLGARIGEELARFDTLIEMHRRNGVAATIRNIGAAAGRRRFTASASHGRALARRMRGSRAARSNPGALPTSASSRRRCDVCSTWPARPLILLARRKSRRGGMARRWSGSRDARPLTACPTGCCSPNGPIASHLGEERGTRGWPAVHRSRPLKNINDALAMRRATGSCRT